MSLAALTLFFALAPATATPADDAAVEISEFLPLPAGGHWLYRSNGSTHSRRVLGVVPVGETVAVECRIQDQRESEPGSGFGLGSRGYAYFGRTKTQILEYGRAYLGDLAGASPHRPRVLLEAPITVGHEWTWTGMIAMQTRKGAEPPASELEIHYRGVIEAVDEECTVPSGQYRAIRVAIHSDNQRWGKSVERFWFARGVGIVKFGSGSTPYELVRWNNPDPRPAPLSLARAAAKRAGLDPERVRPLVDASVTAGYESRFFSVATDPSEASTKPRIEARLIRVREDLAEFFDPTSAEEWRGFFEAEGVRVRASSPGGVSRTVSVLVAERFGAEVGRDGSSLGRSVQSIGAAKAATVTFDLEGKHPTRGNWVSAHTMTLAGGKLNQLVVDFRWKK